MKVSKILYITLLFGFTCFFSCKDDDDMFQSSSSPKNITEIISESPNLSILSDALADVRLDSTLSSTTTYTVFAPTNEAFVSLLNDLGDNYNSLEDFDTAAEKELLATILTYHVSAGAFVESGDLTDNQEIPTVQGESLVAVTTHEISVFDKTGVGSQVIGADNIASNGIVHIIDKVLLPQAVLDQLH